jgi:hypothetical protein
VKHRVLVLEDEPALRRALERGPVPSGFASVVVVDRPAADRLRRLAISPST